MILEKDKKEKLNKEIETSVSEEKEMEKETKTKKKRSTAKPKAKKKEEPKADQDTKEYKRDEEDKTSLEEEALKKTIEELKAKYGELYLNYTEDGTIIIWKPIRRKEYKEIMKNTQGTYITADEKDSAEDKRNIEEINSSLKLYDRQEKICLESIVYPENKEELLDKYAGLATILSEDILMHSGFLVSKSQAL